jgi:hypothetical protein
MDLPTERTSPQITPEDAVTLVYGEPGVGKTTLGNGPDTLILATEPGTGGLEAFVHPVRSWGEFLAVGAELSKGNHRFKHVLVDTADELQRLCQEHVIAEWNRTHPTKKITHPSDLEYGKGYEMLSREWRRLAGFCSLGYGVTFTSHAKSEEINAAVAKRTRWLPSLPGASAKWLLGFSSFIFFLERAVVDGQEVRVLHSTPSERYVAKGRVQRPMPDPLVIESDPPLAAGRILWEAMAEATRVEKPEPVVA